VDEAIQHALAGDDLDRAIRLIDEIAPDLVVRMESNKLLKLVEQLPTDHCQDYPMLCLWHAWALLFLGQLDEVEPILEIADANRNLVATKVPFPGYLTTIRAYLANQRRHLAEAIELSEQALELMEGDPTDRITLIYQGANVIWLGVNHRQLGDLDRAEELLVEAATLNMEAGNIYGALAAKAQASDLAMIKGQLHLAAEILHQGLQMGQKWTEMQGKGRGTLLATSELHLRLGIIHYYWNDFNSAAPHLQRAVELDELGKSWGVMHSYLMLAYLKQAEGDYNAAHELMDRAFKIRDKISVSQFNFAAEPGLEQLQILLSRTGPEREHLLTNVSQQIENLGLRPNDSIDFSSPADYSRESVYADLARALIAIKRSIEALPLLKRLLEGAQVMGRQGDEIRYLVLFSLAHHSLKNNSAALDSLQQAIILAEPQGYVRIFVDEGFPMAELLFLALSQDIAPDYVSRLLTAFPEDVQDAIDTEIALVNITQPLVEPLSEREVEVLRLMAGGYKYQEIADRMIISINTVRHHNRNIFSKLNVNSRVQAIEKARDLNLL
jgi:LuxR family maltose regulon positive regulatory protein